MSAAWITVLGLSVTAALIRASGPLLFGQTHSDGWRRGVVPLLAPALLAALVVTETFADEQRLVLDARAPGVAAAALILWRRPQLLLPAIAVAAAVAAAVRALA